MYYSYDVNKKYKRGDIVNINNFHFIIKYTNPINVNDNLLYIDLNKIYNCKNLNVIKYLQGDIVRFDSNEDKYAWNIYICITDTYKFDYNNFVKLDNVFINMVFNYFYSRNNLFPFETKFYKKQTKQIEKQGKYKELLDRKKELYNSLNNSIEKDKLKILIDVLEKLPNKKIDLKNFDVNNIMNELDKEICGNDNIKKEFIKYFIFNKKKIIGLCGPPGVGKTKMARTLSKIINIPFHQINCGGLKDSNILNGHNYTYIGSKPGKFVDILIKSKCINPIIYVDELDKINESNKNEIYGTLLHAFDEEQNEYFYDNYIDATIDLSNVFFIVSFNNKENIDPILLDRIHVIDIVEYSKKEKINIIKQFINEEMENIKKNFVDEKINFNISENFSEKCLEYSLKNSNQNSFRYIKSVIRTILEDSIIELKLQNKKLDITITERNLPVKNLTARAESYKSLYI
jgi:ATP-dependent Lon protease